MKMFRWTIVTAAMLLVSGAAFADDNEWVTDMDRAMADAKADGKELLLNFTGSDWCGWCVRLRKEVFSQEAFKEYADEHLVLVELDFPRSKKLSKELKKQNDAWKKKFGVSGFPSIILADAEGVPYGWTGYKRGGPGKYVEMLNDLQAKKEKRDKALTAAENTTGLARARLLDEALEAVGQKLAMKIYPDHIEEIIRADADNSAGLRDRYQSMQDQMTLGEMTNELKRLVFVARDLPAANEKADAFLAREDQSNFIRQGLLAFKAQIAMSTGEARDAVALVEQAIALDPDSSMTVSLNRSMSYYKRRLEMQQKDQQEKEKREKERQEQKEKDDKEKEAETTQTKN